MFKNLKEKLATQVTKTNQTLFSTILPLDGVCLQGFLMILQITRLTFLLSLLFH